jgi:glycosyltransferase 2 family protein
MYSILSHKLLLKLAISAILILLILWKFPIYEIIENLRYIKISWFLLAFLLSEFVILSQAFRWHYLLIVPKEQKPNFNILLKYTATGYFFNLLSPGGLGGDAYRSIALGKTHNVIAGSVASVFVARILGLVALCLLFWIALPYAENVPEQAIWFMAAATLFLLIFCFCIVFNPFNMGKLKAFTEKLRAYRKYPLRLLAATLGSLFMQVMVIFIQVTVFKSIGISVPLAFIFAIVSVTALITTIPISFNGIGVREWSMLSLTAYAINSEQLLASLLLSYAIVILQAVQGAIFYISNTNFTKPS